MVPPRAQRGIKTFCRLCKRYDIGISQQTQHLKKEHGLVDDKANRNLRVIKEFIFLEAVQ